MFVLSFLAYKETYKKSINLNTVTWLIGLIKVFKFSKGLGTSTFDFEKNKLNRLIRRYVKLFLNEFVETTFFV